MSDRHQLAFTAVVPCIHCFGPAARLSVGQETDYYYCTRCAKQFGIDWSNSPPVTSPCWPPDIEWWLDQSALPDMIWARLILYFNGTALIIDCDTKNHLFESHRLARQWLTQEEYLPVADLIEDKAVPQAFWPLAQPLVPKS